jgi:hypothetical protein
MQLDLFKLRCFFGSISMLAFIKYFDSMFREKNPVVLKKTNEIYTIHYNHSPRYSLAESNN